MDSAATEKHGHIKTTKKPSLMCGVMELQKFWLNRMGKILSKKRWLAITVNTVTKRNKNCA